MDEKFEFNTENYDNQCKRWPKDGRHILAQYTDHYVIVYQAFNKAIAEYAVRHQKFGGSSYKTGRTTWIKTNFLWMMYRSGWATKDENQERILALYLSIEGFEEILKRAYTTKLEKQEGINRDQVVVRLQWDPDHDPKGESVPRRAIQLGLKPKILRDFNEKWILRIRDVTDFVRQQHRYVLNNDFANLACPTETIFVPKNKDTIRKIELTELPSQLE